MILLASYDFAGTGALPGTFTNRVNSFVRDTDRGKPNTGGAFNWSEYNAVAPPSDVLARLYIYGHTAGNAPGLFLGSSAAGAMGAYLQFGGNGTVLATINGSGSNSPYGGGGTESSTVWADGDYLDVWYDIAAGTLNCSRNGGSVLASVSTSAPSGGVAIWTFTTDQIERVDNLEIYAINSPLPAPPFNKLMMPHLAA